MSNSSGHFHRLFLHPALRRPLLLRERLEAISQGTTGLSSWGVSRFMHWALCPFRPPT